MVSEEQEETIKVVVRIRPLIKREYSHDLCAEAKDSQQVRVFNKKVEYVTTVDAVLPSDADQDRVYESVRGHVLAVAEGISSTIMAYGQTGSGKTYTMLGREMESPAGATVWNRGAPLGPLSADAPPPRSCLTFSVAGPMRGIIPRAVEDLFERVRELGGVWETSVHCSYLQVYSERVCDLLDGQLRASPWKTTGSATTSTGGAAMSQEGAVQRSKYTGLEVREDPTWGVRVSHVCEERVTCCEEVISLLRKGARNRALRQTEYNESSSRSHTLLQLMVEQTSLPTVHGNTQRVRRAKLNLVDLAGSEKWHKDLDVERDGERISEMKAINQSLSALGNCIMALKERRTHIPYRDSKLTRLLADSIGCGKKTALIATISPSILSHDDTRSTLKFAVQARQVMIAVKVNEGEDRAGVMARQEKEIARLKALLRSLTEDDRKMESLTETNSRLTAQLQSTKRQLQEVKEQLEMYEAELARERKARSQLLVAWQERQAAKENSGLLTSLRNSGVVEELFTSPTHLGGAAEGRDAGRLPARLGTGPGKDRRPATHSPRLRAVQQRAAEAYRSGARVERRTSTGEGKHQAESGSGAAGLWHGGHGETLVANFTSLFTPAPPPHVQNAPQERTAPPTTTVSTVHVAHAEVAHAELAHAELVHADVAHAEVDNIPHPVQVADRQPLVPSHTSPLPTSLSRESPLPTSTPPFERRMSDIPSRAHRESVGGSGSGSGGQGRMRQRQSRSPERRALRSEGNVARPRRTTAGVRHWDATTCTPDCQLRPYIPDRDPYNPANISRKWRHGERSEPSNPRAQRGSRTGSPPKRPSPLKERTHALRNSSTRISSNAPAKRPLGSASLREDVTGTSPAVFVSGGRRPSSTKMAEINDNSESIDNGMFMQAMHLARRPTSTVRQESGRLASEMKQTEGVSMEERGCDPSRSCTPSVDVHDSPTVLDLTRYSPTEGVRLADGLDLVRVLRHGEDSGAASLDAAKDERDGGGGSRDEGMGVYRESGGVERVDRSGMSIGEQGLGVRDNSESMGGPDVMVGT